jgi:hypothetical protein
MRALTIALALIALPSFALAQDLAPLSELKACRIDPATVSLAFIFDGGACEQTGEAKAEILEGDTATITVPTTASAEVCTMQVVKVNFAGLVPVPDTVKKLDVQVLSPGGDVVAASDTDIAPNSPDCLPPQAQATSGAVINPPAAP